MHQATVHGFEMPAKIVKAPARKIKCRAYSKAYSSVSKLPESLYVHVIVHNNRFDTS